MVVLVDGAGWGGRLHATEKRIELKVSYPVRNPVAASLGTGSIRCIPFTFTRYAKRAFARRKNLQY